MYQWRNYILITILEYEIKDNSLKVTDDAKRYFDEDGCIIVRYPLLINPLTAIIVYCPFGKGF